MTLRQRKVAVIIPYFQREPGILRRALVGVLQQQLPDKVSVDVFVIDDASPHPAHIEMGDIKTNGQFRFFINVQANGGPGAARNCGLRMVEERGCYDFVAFLDSDDIWSGGHINDALVALDKGYDFYFCDNRRDGVYDSYHLELDALIDQAASIRSRADWVSEDGKYLGFPKLSLKDEMIETCLCHTSCVVLRADSVSGVRFDLELRSAGEDRMFWIELIIAGARVAISWACNVECGRGVNIFFSSFDWNKIETLDRVCNLALFGEKLSRLPNLEANNLTAAVATRDKYRRAYAYLVLRALLKRQKFLSNSFYRFCKYDPLFPLKTPFLAFSVLADAAPDARKF